MHKFFARCLSVALALVMVLSMSASAQSTRVKVELETPEGNFDASIINGFDADGCEQYILESAAIGKLLLQSSDEYLTFGSDENSCITVSSESLREALTMVLYALTSELPVQNIFDILNYINSPLYEADIEAVMMAISVEANRFASVAMNMGLITISENGDLKIEASFEEMVLLVSSYLNALSADISSVETLLNLGILRVLEVETDGIAQNLPAMLGAVADEIASNASGAQDGSLKLYVYANGTMDGGIYISDGDFNQKYELSYNEAGMKLSISGGDGVNFAGIVLLSGNEGLTFTVDFSAQGQIVDIDASMNAEGIKATGKIDAFGLKGEFDFVSDNTKVVLNGEMTDGYSTITTEGNFDFVNGEYVFKYLMNNRYTTEKFNFEYIDEELYLECVTTESGETLTNVIITGSKAYRVNATWNSGYSEKTLTGTLRAKDGGLTFEGDLNTASKTYYRSGSTCHIKASVAGGEFSCELGISNGRYEYDVALSMSADSVKFSLEPEQDGEDLGCLTGELTVNENGLAGGFKFENIYDGEVDQAYSANFTLDNNGLVITALANERGNEIPVSIIVSSDLIEGKINMYGTEVRGFIEKALSGDMLKLEAGLTAAPENDPSMVQEAVKALLNMNLANFVHEGYVNIPSEGVYATTSFDGTVYTLVCKVNDEEVKLTGRYVQEANNAYILINIEGEANMTVKIGAKLTDANEKRIYAEAESNGEVSGVAVVMNTTATESSVSTTYALETYQNGADAKLGSLTVSYEVLPGTLEHIEGQELTAEQLAQIIYGLLQSVMYY